MLRDQNENWYVVNLFLLEKKHLCLSTKYMQDVLNRTCISKSTVTNLFPSFFRLLRRTVGEKRWVFTVMKQYTGKLLTLVAVDDIFQSFCRFFFLHQNRGQLVHPYKSGNGCILWLQNVAASFWYSSNLTMEIAILKAGKVHCTNSGRKVLNKRNLKFKALNFIQFTTIEIQIVTT